MNRLNGTDASFLYADTQRTPMHIGSVQLIDVPVERRATFFDDVKALYRARADRLRYIDHRLTHAPLQLDHPRWTACDVDYDAHVERIEAPAPGNIGQLERIVADLHATPLDRSRPLWKTYYIDGLEHGRAAYFNVVHHACLDGVSGQAAVDALTDPTPHASPTGPSAHGAGGEPADSSNPYGDWAGAGFDALMRAARALDAAMRLGPRGLTTMQRRGPAAWVAPATPINRAISPLRNYAMLRISLTDTRAIGKARGCSINDVLLTLCGGALRQYLSMRGALPDRASGAADYVAPWINLVISNVPGPRAIRYSSGARMLTHFPVSIPAHGAALNITAQSYAEHFDIGVTACAHTVPDVALLRDALRDAYIELRARVLRRGLDVRESQRALPDVERRCSTNDRLVA
jgi:WS/DGAT/MGAT family acyltransferase